jgi:hypothetical protein
MKTLIPRGFMLRIHRRKGYDFGEDVPEDFKLFPSHLYVILTSANDGLANGSLAP